MVLQCFGELIINCCMHSQNDSLTESPSTTTQSQFYLNGRRLCVSSSCAVSVRPGGGNGGQGGMQFISEGCEVVGDQLRKCYRIMVADVFICVQDKISLDSTYRNFQKQPNNHHLHNHHKSGRGHHSNHQNKKMVLFKNNSQTHPHLHTSNHKKNIAKNIVNAFIKYLRHTHSQDPTAAQTVLTSVSQLAKSIKYNNQLISEIVEQPGAREYFRQFLTSNAMSWLVQSKIKTKQIYEQAIRLYVRLCDERQSQMNRKVSPVQVKESSNSNNSICFRELQNYELQQQIRGFK